MAKATPAPPAPTPPANMVIDLTPPPEAKQALALRDQVTGMVVNDKASHEAALTSLRQWKQLRRAIDEHWSRITRTADEMKRQLLDLKRKDLEPVDYVIGVATNLADSYREAEERRVRAEQDRLRREAEQRAADDRARQLEEQEARALQLEADSPNLSNREQIFVEAIAVHPVGVSTEIAKAAAVRAGYKNPLETSQRLLATPKIMDAIRGKREARELRQQAAATKQQPLDVVQPAKVQSNVGRVAGIRNTTTWSCDEDIDLSLLRQAYIDGKVPLDTLVPNQPFLNDQARQLHEAFNAAYPGCRYVKKTGIAG